MTQRTGGRAVEGARLESVYTFKAYRGFESPSVRHKKQSKITHFLLIDGVLALVRGKNSLDFFVRLSRINCASTFRLT